MNHARYTIAAVIIVFLVLCSVLCMLYACLGRNSEHVVIVPTIDARLSPSVVAEITAYLTHYPYDDTFKQRIKGLSDVIPCVHHCVCRHTIPGRIQVQVIALDPVVRLNGNILMATQGELLSTDYFIRESYQNLPNITLPTHYMLYKRLPREMHQFLSSIPAELFDRFFCVWHADHYLLLRDKEYPCTIVCDTQKAPDIAVCDVRKKIPVMQNDNTCTKYKNSIIDVRFTDQIVVYKDTRGVKL
jgi:hypothetical protein